MKNITESVVGLFDHIDTISAHYVKVFKTNKLTIAPTFDINSQRDFDSEHENGQNYFALPYELKFDRKNSKCCTHFISLFFQKNSIVIEIGCNQWYISGRYRKSISEKIPLDDTNELHRVLRGIRQILLNRKQLDVSKHHIEIQKMFSKK